MIIAVDELPKVCKECTFLWYDDESFALCSAQGSQKLMNSNDIKKRDPNCPLKKIYIDNNGLWGTVFLGKEMEEEFQKVLKKWKERNRILANAYNFDNMHIITPPNSSVIPNSSK